MTNPEDYVEDVMKRVRKEYLVKTYGIQDYEGHIDFLEQLAKKFGKLLKGAEPDINTIAKMVLNDWQRGRLPFYVPPEGFAIPKSVLEAKAKEADVEVAVANEDDEDAEVKSVVTNISESVLKGRDLQQLQDFRKIRVGLEFEPEDIKALDMENLKQFEEQKKEQDERRKRKNRGDEDEESSGISDFYSEDEYNEESGKVTHKAAGSRTKATPPSQKKIKTKESTSTGFFNVEEVEENKVKMEDTSNKKVAKKLTSKQKRAVDRKEKPRKIGSNFYDVVNVKNKTNSKKFNAKKQLK